MEQIPKKPLRGLALVDDETPAPKSVQKPQQPLTLKILDEYVAKLAQFERAAMVGQEAALRPSQLSSLQDLQSSGRGAFKFKKPETESEKVARIVSPILKKSEGS